MTNPIKPKWRFPEGHTYLVISDSYGGDDWCEDLDTLSELNLIQRMFQQAVGISISHD